MARCLNQESSGDDGRPWGRKGPTSHRRRFTVSSSCCLWPGPQGYNGPDWPLRYFLPGAIHLPGSRYEWLEGAGNWPWRVNHPAVRPPLGAMEPGTRRARRSHKALVGGRLSTFVASLDAFIPGQLGFHILREAVGAGDSKSWWPSTLPAESPPPSIKARSPPLFLASRIPPKPPLPHPFGRQTHSARIPEPLSPSRASGGIKHYWVGLMAAREGAVRAGPPGARTLLGLSGLR